MWVEYIDVAYRQSFGFRVDQVDRIARKHIEQGKAVPYDPVKKKRKEDPRPLKRDKGMNSPKDKMIRPVVDKASRDPFQTRFTRVAWVADLPPRPWGAELSNAQVIRVGRDLGYEIVEVHQRNLVSPRVIREADVVVLNNMFLFGEKQFTMILDVLMGEGKPYVRYEHDFSFCKYRQPPCLGRMDGAGPVCELCCVHSTPQNFRQVEIYRRLFSRATLNVFISPMHREIHERALGENNIEPCHILTPPVDVDRFNMNGEGIEREEDLIISTAGKFNPQGGDKKGWSNVRDYIDGNPEFRYEIYTGPHPEIMAWKSLNHSNVSIIQPVPWETLPGIYQRASKCLFLPNMPDAAGRTVIEAALCGCEPVMNDMVGVGSFPQKMIDLSNLDVLREQIERGPYNFWKQVDRYFG